MKNLSFFLLVLSAAPLFAESPAGKDARRGFLDTTARITTVTIEGNYRVSCRGRLFGRPGDLSRKLCQSRRTDLVCIVAEPETLLLGIGTPKLRWKRVAHSAPDARARRRATHPVCRRGMFRFFPFPTAPSTAVSSAPAPPPARAR